MSSIRQLPGRTTRPQHSQLLLAPSSEGRKPSPYGASKQAFVPEARNLFPATPQPKSSSADRAGGQPEEGPHCATLPLCSLLASWLRSTVSGNLGRCEVQTAVQITDALCSSALLTLQLSRSLLLPASPDTRAAQSIMLDALPNLCK